MIKLTAIPGNGSVKVSFVLPVEADAIGVAGEFNGWDAGEAPFRKRANGTRSAVVTLARGTAYRFRYVAPDGHWFNDDTASAFVDNGFGSTDCVLTT